MMRYLLLICLLLAGCGGGAVVFAPTPSPPDISPTRYQHPSGAFSLTVPRTWAVYEQNTTTLATTAFSPPGSASPLLTAAVINLGQSLDTAAFADLLTQYQSNIRPDVSRYTEQSRQAMGDGSWRMTGVRSLPGGAAQPINTFIEQDSGFIAVLDVLLPADDERMTEIQGVLNTFAINTEAELQTAPLAVLVSAASATLDVVRVATWSTPAGVFYITGEVVNYGSQTAVDLPVRAVLYNADGLPLAEAVDTPMGYGITPGEFAPFSLRFGQGQPSQAISYTIILGGADWSASDDVLIYSADALQWTDETGYNDRDELVISGTVTNTGAQTLLEPRIVVTIFGADQTVIAARFADLTVNTLPPGDSAPYEMIVPEIGGEPVEYIVNIQARP